MTTNLRRLRRRTRTLAVQCRTCHQWRKPRHLRVPAMVCRDCETTPAFQTWTPRIAEVVGGPG
jgi:hypothetical protein